MSTQEEELICENVDSLLSSIELNYVDNIPFYE